MASVQQLVADMEGLAATPVTEVSLADATERIIVDMDSRHVTINSKFFGNIIDHLAKRKVFEITRYVNGVDLAEHTCVIHWENGTNGGVIPVTKRDLSEEGKILIPWEITVEFTQNKGLIVFAVHFFSIVDGAFTYHISSNPAQGELRETLNATDHSLQKITPSEMEVFIQKMLDLSAEIDEKLKYATDEGKVNTPLDEEGNPTHGNAGQFLQSNGDRTTKWTDLPKELPEVTEADNGKIAQVVNGIWTAVDIINGNEVEY